MKNPIIYYRAGLAESGEFEQAKKYFRLTPSRMTIQANDLVICRYSAWPFYKELEDDVRFKGASLINSYDQHRYVADLQNWVKDLRDFTPQTWDDLSHLPEKGPFVLKGETNSKKFEWKTHMYAADRQEAGEVFSRLCADGLVGSQKIYIRQFLPLVTYYEAIGGLPVTKEFRIFVAFGQVLTGGFYWSSHAPEVAELNGGKMPSIDEIPTAWLAEVLCRIGNKVNFYCIDVAQLISGEWTVIELNDGQQAGLSEADPDVLYGELRRALHAVDLSP